MVSLMRASGRSQSLVGVVVSDGTLDTPASVVDADAEAEALALALELSRARWPGVDLGGERFLAHLRSKTGSGEALTLALKEAWSPEHPGGLRVADLYLACACAEGVPAALEAFEGHALEQVRTTLRRHRDSEAEIDELLQVLRIKLFIGGSPGRVVAPRILDYSGRGSLRKWTITVALRALLNLRRATRREAPSRADELVERLTLRGDVDLELVRLRHALQFKRALAAALGELSPEDRNLLRLVVVEGVTLERLGRLRGLHKSNVSRQLARARRTLRSAVRARLTRELGLRSAETDSLLRLLVPGASISLRAFL